MQKLHEDLTERHPWYARWHELSYVSLVHFAVLAAVSGYFCVTLVEAAAKQGDTAAAVVMAEAAPKGDVSDLRPHPGTDFGPWFKMALWRNCAHLMQQGSIFEIQNSEGQSMWSECTPNVPERPFGWHSDPARFRLVKEPKPQHSDPHPLPQNIDNARP